MSEMGEQALDLTDTSLVFKQVQQVQIMRNFRRIYNNLNNLTCSDSAMLVSDLT